MLQPKNSWIMNRLVFFSEISLTYSPIAATDDYGNLSVTAFLKISEVYLEYWQTSKMKPLAKVLNGFM